MRTRQRRPEGIRRVISVLPVRTRNEATRAQQTDHASADKFCVLLDTYCHPLPPTVTSDMVRMRGHWRMFTKANGRRDETGVRLLRELLS